MAMATTFTRMDESTAEQWAVIGGETMENQPRVADAVLAMLRSLADVTDGFATDQLTHCLQTATLAERAGADDEMVVASLCHDIGKAVSVPNHPEIAAAILQAVRARRGPPGDPGPPGLPGSRTTTTTSAATRTHASSTAGAPLVRARRAVRRRVGPDRVRPRLRHAAPRALRAARAQVFGSPHSM